MTRPRFLTVPTELLEYAESVAEYFQSRGCRVKPEHFAVGFPARPTLVCTRKSTTVIVEVNTRVPNAVLEQWCRYAASCSSDTQIALCVPARTSIPSKAMYFVQQSKVGLYLAQASSCIEQLPPYDLALRVAFPELKSLPARVRELLGAVYEQFDRGQWREGFKEACQVLEEQARKHLKLHLQSGRVVVLDGKGNERKLSKKDIDRMTLGALAKAYANIKTPNAV